MAEQDQARAWGRSMVREFAAKQQIVPLGHMFTAEIGASDLRQLRALSIAARAILDGRCDGAGFRRLLCFEGDITTACALLRAAAGPLNSEEAGFALALAYLPFEIADAFAVAVLEGAAMKKVAAAIDPRAALAVRSRLYLADNLIRNATVRGLVSCTATAAALRDNASDAAGLCEARARLARLAQAADVCVAQLIAFSGALKCCLDGDWHGAQAHAVHIAGAAGIASGCTFSDPPALADLLLISLLPSCDTIDAARRLWITPRSSASRACAAPD